MIHDIKINPLKILSDKRGKVMHMLRKDSDIFQKFGEIYFSTIFKNAVKAWHLHQEATLNYVCIKGKVKLVLFDNRERSPSKGKYQEIVLSPKNYFLVTIPPNVWNGFKNLDDSESIIANCLTIPHDEKEMVRKEPFDKSFNYDWWDKNKLAEQFNFLKKNKKYKVVCTNFYLYWQDKKKLTKKYVSKLPSGKITQQLLNDYFIAISGVLVKRKIFKSRLFNEKYNIIGDFDFFIDISRSYLIGVINKPLLFYRIHNANFSNTKINIYYDEQKNWLENNGKKFLKEKYSLTYVKIYLIKLKIKTILRYLINILK